MKYWDGMLYHNQWLKVLKRIERIIHFNTIVISEILVSINYISVIDFGTK